MLAYLALFGLPLLWAVSRRLWPASERAVMLFVALALTLFVGLRHLMGGDWHSYWLMLERAHLYPIGTALLVSDPAYMALNIVAARLGLAVGAVNLVCAALLVAGLLAYCRRLSSPPMALWIAIPVLIAVAAANSTRQVTAVGLEMGALALLLRGAGLGRPALLLVLACAFHWTAAVLLPIVALFALPPGRRIMLLAALGLAGAAGLALIWASQGAADDPAEMAGAALRLVPSLAAVLLLPALRERLRLGEEAWAAAGFLAWLSLLCTLMLPLLPMAAGRLYYYTIPLQMMVLPAAVAAVPGLWLRRAALAGLAASMAAMLIVWFIVSPYARCLQPYRSYLQEPEALFGREAPQLMCQFPSG